VVRAGDLVPAGAMLVTPAQDVANNICFLGGVFHDCLVHDFDLLRWIIGEDPKTVYCVGKN